MKTRVLLPLFWLVLIVTACDSTDAGLPTPPVETARATPTLNVPGTNLGESFTLMKGETATIEGDLLVVGVIEVLEDSRCPNGVECFWAGNAKVLVSVGEQEFTLTIGKLLEGDQNAVELGGGLSLRLLRVDPYPEASEGSNDYHVTLILESESSQPFNYPKSI